ncbi:hypothetical protein BC936DRAFT_147272 [Jimgerdemannia flammicorona]|uniref:Uncharacterized protein n=1 Tax=Jimgerdemannia flammicorona TaxID=994334 RepID=A0A433D5P1_9FUNG|nr:hypothetical protein BC936DRAFT_147272 [Jimgerdemannia flammicorona]
MPQALVSFYGWMWIAMIVDIMVLLYALGDVLLHLRDYKTVTDMRLGCIVAFSWFLVVEVVVGI